MRKRGQGPKDVLVPKYRQWRRGKLVRISTALRANSHKLALRRSKDQMSLGF
jgi:hypothetical protein